VDASGNRQRLLLAVVGVLVLAVLAGAVALWPRGRLAEPAGGGQADPTRLVPATLTSVQTVPCQEAEPGLPGSTCIKVRARPDGAEEVEFDTTDPTGDTFRSGQRVRLSILEQAGQPTFYNIRDLERGRPMVALAALFVLAVIAFGRWQGVRSLIGLACSFAVIVGFVVPAILRGRSPVPVALVGAMAIMLASLYLSHGVGRKTTAAVVGTALALALTGALTAGFVELTALTGLASEDALNANFQVGGISLQGLLLAGIILGGLGVLDDVTVSQASLVFELRRADPAAGFAELTGGALAVGRDHVAASVNTLFLAYAGASLPLLVLFVSGGDPLGTVVTAEAVAVEVVRTLCGSVGLIAAVPLTTVLAANLALEEPAAGPGGPGDRRGGHPVDRGGPATPAPGTAGSATRRPGAWTPRRRARCSARSSACTVPRCRRRWSGSRPATRWPSRRCRRAPARPPGSCGGWPPRPAGRGPHRGTGARGRRAGSASTRPTRANSSCSGASGPSRPTPGSGSRATRSR
jgi:uncharacterized membrane protein